MTNHPGKPQRCRPGISAIPLNVPERRDLAEHPVAVRLRRAGQVLREPPRLAERVLARRWIDDAWCLRVGHRGAIAERPHVVGALDAERLVHDDATALVERNVELGEKRARAHAGRPDERSRRDAHTVREHCLAAVVGLERRADVDLDAATLQPPRGVLPETARDLGEDLRGGVDEHPALWFLAESGVRAKRGMRHVVQLRERLDARVAGADEDEPELGGVVRVDRRALELQQDAVAERDRVSEVLEAHPVLREPGHGEHARPSPRARRRAARIRSRSVRRASRRRPILRVAIVARDVAEDELGVRAHLPERHDDVARLERPRRRLGEERRVQHEVLARDDRRAMALQQSRDVASGEAAAEDQGSAACFASLHGSCLPRWRIRSR